MKFYNLLFIRAIILILLTGLAVFFALKEMPYNLLLIGVLILLVSGELYYFIRTRLLFYDKTILSILHNDFTTHFPESHRRNQFKNLYRLYESAKTTQHQLNSREAVYSSILNNVETGVIILEREQDSWTIFLMNACFSKTFDVPRVSHWKYLKKQIPSFCDEIEKAGFAEMKIPINISIDGKDLQTFILQTSKTQSFGSEYYIILLDSIQRVIEKREKEAWINMMKVISHELMNSLTPIRSLAQTLHETVSQEELSTEDLNDIRESLLTIVGRSSHLQFFVENYRKLTMLPTPQKELVNIGDLMNESIAILRPMLDANRIDIRNEVDLPKSVMVDPKQIGQVFINLLTNSIYAVSETSKKQIVVTSFLSDNRVTIVISDSGQGIDNQIRDKIFLPFFTTRKDGAGIGLTLSKNIIEAHGGHLNQQSENGVTSFVITLVI
ncbi:MAG: GHKL domain-containing protein [Flavobacterium sp.]|nr:GHKL domain-containing protein [Flavobacterium sp.]